MVLLNLLDANKFNIKLEGHLLLLESMLLIGKHMPVEYLIIVILKLIMLSLWLDQVKLPGLLKTHGAHLGVNKDSLDWRKEILVPYAKDHHSHSEL